MMYVRICSVEDCNKKHKGHGYCDMHLRRYKLYGDPNILILNKNAGKICIVENCESLASSKEYCIRHYVRQYKYGDPNFKVREYYKGDTCSVDGCSNKHCHSGYCKKHYKRLRESGNINSTKNMDHDGYCSLPECSNKYDANGFCKNHNHRYKKYGDPLGLADNSLNYELKTYLYILYNSNKEVLYIGITKHFRHRMTEHKSSKSWWQEVAEIEKVEHPNRAKAIESERIAIAKYKPKYNVIHNREKVEV